MPVIVLDHLSEQERKAYILADNRLAELAQWDEELLADELSALQADGADMEAIGWTDDELAEMLESIEMLDTVDPDQDADDVPEIPEDRFRSLVTFGSWAATASCVATAPTCNTSKN